MLKAAHGVHARKDKGEGEQTSKKGDRAPEPNPHDPDEKGRFVGGGAQVAGTMSWLGHAPMIVPSARTGQVGSMGWGSRALSGGATQGLWLSLAACSVLASGAGFLGCVCLFLHCAYLKWVRDQELTRPRRNRLPGNESPFLTRLGGESNL